MGQVAVCGSQGEFKPELSRHHDRPDTPTPVPTM